jgi:GntR family transcriptional regulator, N-acetylglucosamine utilization regulator
MSISGLNKDLPVPLYHQLKCLLMEAIDAGQFQPGQQLPNEAQLAGNYGISKITVRQALQGLAELGYISRQQGKGTFVSRPKLDLGPRELLSFNEEMRRHRMTPASRVLEQSVTDAEPRIAEGLQIAPGAPVFRLKRLRLADGEPMGIQTAYVPLELAMGIEKESFEDTSLYQLLQMRYGLLPSKARETHLAVSSDAAVAELLGVPEGSPMFAAERVTFLPDGRPFEFVESHMRGDRYSIVLDLVADRAPQAVRQGGTRH